jgi:glycosyltransferase involved in cell wall biosynthesis
VRRDPRVTVVFLLYNAESMVLPLADAIRKQVHPEEREQATWLECIFLDDCSRDRTAVVAQQALTELPSGFAHRLEVNPENLGLARSVNRAFELARAPFVLTCHCDCLFGDEQYVFRMLGHMERTPDAGAITGKPRLAAGRALSFVERVNAVVNLMDIVPYHGPAELLPVGFAEGRCDIFRVSAIRAAGMYGTSYRTAGEDQELAARLRAAGFRVYQAMHAIYDLSVSDEQNTLRKLARHAWLFGKVHPLLLLAESGTRSGVIGSNAGLNRSARTLLRLSQLLSTASYAVALATLLSGQWLLAACILLGIAGVKVWLFRHHLKIVPFSALELARLFASQPMLDVAYSAGVCTGAALLTAGWNRSRRTV